MLTATATGGWRSLASRHVAIDPTPLLRLSLAPDPGPAVPGQPFSYTLTYGNVGLTSPSGIELRMPVPAGTNFASATGGGAETGGVVTWALDTVAPGAGGQVRLTVDVSGSLPDGRLLEARPELDAGLTSESVARCTAVTPVYGDSPLHVAYAVGQSATGLGDDLICTVLATNTGPLDLTNVTAQVLLPVEIASFQPTGSDLYCAGVCSPGESALWTIGTLEPGESRDKRPDHHGRRRAGRGLPALGADRLVGRRLAGHGRAGRLGGSVAAAAAERGARSRAGRGRAAVLLPAHLRQPGAGDRPRRDPPDAAAGRDDLRLGHRRRLRQSGLRPLVPRRAGAR